MDGQYCSPCFIDFYKVEELFQELFSCIALQHTSVLSINSCVVPPLAVLSPLLVHGFSAPPLKRVIISVYDVLSTNTVSGNWEATDNKLQTVTSYTTLKQAVNSSVTLSPVLYYLDTFI